MSSSEATAPVLDPTRGGTAAVPLRPVHVVPAAGVGVAAAAATVATLGVSTWSVAAAATAATLVWVAAIDLETRVIPNRIVLPATLALVAVAAAIDPALGIGRAAAALAAGALLLVPVVLRPGGLGMGDVKLAGLLGALLGAGFVEALVVGFGLAGLVGVALVARRGRVALTTPLPLAPFLAVGAIVALLLG